MALPRPSTAPILRLFEGLTVNIDGTKIHLLTDADAEPVRKVYAEILDTIADSAPANGWKLLRKLHNIAIQSPPAPNIQNQLSSIVSDLSKIGIHHMYTVGLLEKLSKKQDLSINDFKSAITGIITHIETETALGGFNSELKQKLSTNDEFKALVSAREKRKADVASAAAAPSAALVSKTSGEKEDKETKGTGRYSTIIRLAKDAGISQEKIKRPYDDLIQQLIGFAREAKISDSDANTLIIDTLRKATYQSLSDACDILTTLSDDKILNEDTYRIALRNAASPSPELITKTSGAAVTSSRPSTTPLRDFIERLTNDADKRYTDDYKSKGATIHTVDELKQWFDIELKNYKTDEEIAQVMRSEPQSFDGYTYGLRNEDRQQLNQLIDQTLKRQEQSQKTPSTPAKKAAVDKSSPSSKVAAGKQTPPPSAAPVLQIEQGLDYLKSIAAFLKEALGINQFKVAYYMEAGAKEGEKAVVLQIEKAADIRTKLRKELGLNNTAIMGPPPGILIPRSDLSTLMIKAGEKWLNQILFKEKMTVSLAPAKSNSEVRITPTSGKWNTDTIALVAANFHDKTKLKITNVTDAGFLNFKSASLSSTKYDVEQWVVTEGKRRSELLQKVRNTLGEKVFVSPKEKSSMVLSLGNDPNTIYVSFPTYTNEVTDSTFNGKFTWENRYADTFSKKLNSSGLSHEIQTPRTDKVIVFSGEKFEKWQQSLAEKERIEEAKAVAAANERIMKKSGPFAKTIMDSSKQELGGAVAELIKTTPTTTHPQPLDAFLPSLLALGTAINRARDKAFMNEVKINNDRKQAEEKYMGPDVIRVIGIIIAKEIKQSLKLDPNDLKYLEKVREVVSKAEADRNDEFLNMPGNALANWRIYTRALSNALDILFNTVDTYQPTENMTVDESMTSAFRRFTDSVFNPNASLALDAAPPSNAAAPAKSGSSPVMFSAPSTSSETSSQQSGPGSPESHSNVSTPTPLTPSSKKNQ